MALNKSGTYGAKRTRGFPRVINAGHGIKLGAVVSSFDLTALVFSPLTSLPALHR